MKGRDVVLKVRGVKPSPVKPWTVVPEFKFLSKAEAVRDAIADESIPRDCIHYSPTFDEVIIDMGDRVSDGIEAICLEHNDALKKLGVKSVRLITSRKIP